MHSRDPEAADDSTFDVAPVPNSQAGTRPCLRIGRHDDLDRVDRIEVKAMEPSGGDPGEDGLLRQHSHPPLEQLRWIVRQTSVRIQTSTNSAPCLTSEQLAAEADATGLVKREGALHELAWNQRASGHASRVGEIVRPGQPSLLRPRFAQSGVTPVG